MKFLSDVYYSLCRLWSILKPVPIRWKKLAPNSKTPTRTYATDGGFDLVAVEEVHLPPGSHINVGTGIAIEVQPGWSYDIRGRSGLNRRGILCSLGLSDAMYQGEIRAVLSNLSGSEYVIQVGDRVAQIKVNPVYDFRWEEVQEFKHVPGTRGEKGWGSSGR